MVYERRDISPTKMEMHILLIKSFFRFLSEHVHTTKQLQIYIYFTGYKKLSPPPHITLSQSHLNTGYTIVDDEFVYIFRKEEWFKVLLHELMHVLDIDHKSEKKSCESYLQPKNKQHLCPKNEAYKHFEGHAEWHAIVFNVLYHAILTNSTSQLPNQLEDEWHHVTHYLKKHEDIRIFEYGLERESRLKTLLNQESKKHNKEKVIEQKKIEIEKVIEKVIEKEKSLQGSHLGNWI